MSVQYEGRPKLLRELLEQRGGTNLIIESFDHFVEYGINQVLTSQPLEIKNRKKVIMFGKSVLYPPNMTPAEARFKDVNFAGILMAQIAMYDVVDGQLVPDPNEKPLDVDFGYLHVMVGSKRDPTSRLSKIERYHLGEPLEDKGGYIISCGDEKVLQFEEHLRKRVPFLYKDKNVVVVRYTSKRLLESTINVVTENDFEIVCSFTKMRKQDTVDVKKTEDKKTSMNIFVMFYALGITNDTVNKAMAFMEDFITSDDVEKNKKRKLDLHSTLTTTIQAYKMISSITANDIEKVKRQFPNDSQNMLIQKAVRKNIMHYLNGIFENIIEAPADQRDAAIINSIRVDFLRNIEYKPGDTSETGKAILESKVRTLAYMIVKYIDYKNGHRDLDDRDSWGNKHLETPGMHFLNRFAAIWNKMIIGVQAEINSGEFTTLKQIKDRFSRNTFITEFETSFRQNTWGPSRKTNDSIIVQTMERDNLISIQMSLRRITTPTNRRSEMKHKRYVHNSQFNVACHAFTPEGETAGLIKDAAITLYVSMERDERLLLEILKGKFKTTKQEPEFIHPIFLNGMHLGFCQAKNLKKELDSYRRTNRIYIDTGIILNSYNELWVYTTSGRPIIPYLVVNQETLQLVYNEKNLHNASLTEVFLNGAIEYIDVAEQVETTTYLAETEADLTRQREFRQLITDEYKNALNDPSYDPEALEILKDNYTKTMARPVYTHCMIDPQTILGISAFTIPYIGHMPGTRASYQSNMAKQALPGNAIRNELRFDNLSRKTVAHPNLPLQTTMANQLVGLDTYPQGSNTVIAVMPSGGSNQEDSIVVKAGSRDRGLFMDVVYHSYKVVVNNAKKYQEKVKVPSFPPHKAQYYNKLDPKTGIVRIGESVKTDDCIIGKITINSETKQEFDTSIYLEIGKEGVVEDVSSELVNGDMLIQVRIRETKYVEVGDKIASQYSQKGIVSEIINDKDASIIVSDDPRLDGVSPDIQFNPHSLPSRMTIGKVIEILLGNKVAWTGKRLSAQAYRPFDYLDTAKEIQKYGFKSSGKYKMLNGKTGLMMDVEIFTGIVYYQALKHLVKYKCQARGTVGPNQTKTRQPMSGIRRYGGLRFGEMERDSFIAHGAGSLLKERMSDSSDKHVFALCNKCGNIVSTEGDMATYFCPVDKTNKYIVSIELPYITTYLQKLLAGAGQKIALEAIPKTDIWSMEK